MWNYIFSSCSPYLQNDMLDMSLKFSQSNELKNQENNNCNEEWDDDFPWIKKNQSQDKSAKIFFKSKIKKIKDDRHRAQCDIGVSIRENYFLDNNFFDDWDNALIWLEDNRKYYKLTK